MPITMSRTVSPAGEVLFDMGGLGHWPFISSRARGITSFTLR